MTHKLSAASWGIVVLLRTEHRLSMVKAVDVFGWMTSPALAQSQRSVTAAFPAGVQRIVPTLKTREFFAIVSDSFSFNIKIMQFSFGSLEAAPNDLLLNPLYVK